MEGSVIFIGNANAKHVKRFFSNLSDNDFRNIVLFNTGEKTIRYWNNYEVFGGHVYFKTPLIRVLYNYIILVIEFIRCIKKRNAALVNIHSIGSDALLFILIAKIFKVNTVLTPWGSDIYRIGFLGKTALRLSLKLSDIVTYHNIDIKIWLLHHFNLPESKFFSLRYGSEVVQFLHKFQIEDRIIFRKHLNILADKIIITIGYTANKSQKHIDIIHALNLLERKLKTKIFLVVPMTYGPDRDDRYKGEVEELLNLCEIEYRILNNYLEPIEIAKWRWISDIFICMQATDGFSASLQEFIVSPGKVIIGSWLKYSELEIEGLPYISINGIETLPDCVTKVICGPNFEICVDEGVRSSIFQRSWSNVIREWIDFYLSYSNRP